MSDMTLAAVVKAAAEKFAIPGVAVAVWSDGTATYACHGVTSLEDPRPVDEHTLYSLGSISKTFTATAMMRLVAQGKVDLDAPVRRYVPELVLPSEQWTSEMTVLNLLNHTAGLDWRLIADTGDRDDALARFVARLAGFGQLAAPGTRTSYSQAGYNLAGRIIEKVTGLTFERAVATLILEPLGLTDTLYAMDDIMRGQPSPWGTTRTRTASTPSPGSGRTTAPTTPAEASHPRSPTSCDGRASTSATAARPTAPRCCRPRHCTR